MEKAMTTKVDVVRTWAERWRCLLAWGAPVPAVLKIEPWRAGKLGSAHCLTKQVLIRTTKNLAEDLATALHELAHLAAPNFVHHEMPWRVLLARATTEACGCDFEAFDLDVRITDLDAQVVAAVTAWLEVSGQGPVLRAIGVM